ncbi:phage antirepressor [Pseudomonas aeruginosa]|nr:phage antirepressor [Pseudomonas aeruginosa]
MSDALLHPSRFTHHHRVLRAVLLDEEGWFVLSDLVRLLGRYLGGRAPAALCDEAPWPLATAEQRERLFALCHALERHLDTDQWRLAWLHDERHGPRQDCLVSESGLYALLWLAAPGAARVCAVGSAARCCHACAASPAPTPRPSAPCCTGKPPRSTPCTGKARPGSPSATAPNSSTAHAR